jgi:energy-coupling factor transporter ATP-binding protein EcfA2
MINKLEFKFGSSLGQPNLEIEPTAITVFVGPNNSGKSKAIAEIAAQCTAGGRMTSDVILENVIFDGFSETEAEAIIAMMEVAPQPGSAAVDQHIFIGTKAGQQQIFKPNFLLGLQQPNDYQRRAEFAQYYLGPRTLMLNGRNRMDLVNDQQGGDLQQAPQLSFQKLFRDDALRNKFSRIVQKSLNRYAVLDPTSLGQLRLRLSTNLPDSPEVERGLGDASVKFHASALHIAIASDGAKAFTGILAEILAGDPKVLLMDEPEAFLHPSLAFNLGRDIAQSLAAADKRMFVSTHSPQFLMGCIQSGVPINVVRLTYRNDVATARLLPSNEIVRLMRNPLLRSVGVISALFYESVVVTEADPDRAFYQEVNERLLSDGRGIPNCIFLNAQNKQTIPFIVGPLRALGIPTAAIYDVDFVKDGGGVATRFMETAGIPDLARQGLTTTRAALAIALTNANTKYKTEGGVGVLTSADRPAADDYFDQLDAYGAFVVRGGELESWLKPLGATGHGPSWLIPMFEKMGEDPSLQGYLRPAQNDVWQFIDGVAAWLLNPQRKGIPE